MQRRLAGARSGAHTRIAAIGLLVVAVGPTASAADGWSRGDIPPPSFNRVWERTTLKNAHGRGTLVDIHTGPAEQVTVIAIHGIGGSPSDLAAVMRKDIDADHTVKAFVYDDKFRTLEDSSADLALAIEQWSALHPAAPLRIDAHSMGGRVAIGALAVLAKDREVSGQVQLNLIAVPLEGFRRANFVRWLPRFLPWVRPLNGLGSRSGYQRMIERLRVPGNVEVNVFAGGRDRVFACNTDRYRALVRILHGTLRVFPDATHMSTVEEVARLR